MQIDPRTRAEVDAEQRAGRPAGGVRRPRFASASERLGAWWYRWGLWLLVVGGLVLLMLAALVLIEVSRTGRLPWSGSVTPTSVVATPPASPVAPTPMAPTIGVATPPVVVATVAPSPQLPPATAAPPPPTP